LKLGFFPILNDQCDIICKSLKYFILEISYIEISFDVFNNIYNNIDNMPNLVAFTLKGSSKEIKEDFYVKFIKKFFQLKIFKVLV
jgi:hypothetical protein